MERRRITVFDKSKEFQKIEQNKCNEMIINDILNPLLQIIYALRESDNFNNIPGTDVGKKQAGTITQANLIIFTEPLTATYFFQNINQFMIFPQISAYLSLKNVTGYYRT